MIKKVLRTVFRIRDNETFFDGLTRHYYSIEKRIPYKKTSIDQLSQYIDYLGISKGDVLIVHASWRAMYMFDGSPEDLIDLLLEKIGNGGVHCLCPATDRTRGILI